MKLKHLQNLHSREKKRLLKNIVPSGIRRLYKYHKYKKTYPNCFISSNSSITRHTKVGQSCLIQESSIGANVEIGDFTTIGHQGRFGGRGKIKIGKFCSIAPECLIWSENHYSNCPSSYPFEHMLKGHNDTWEEYHGHNIEVGNSVWIGQRVTVLAGAKIGDGSIVAAGTVVAKGVYPPYSLIGGVPAKVIKQRFSDKKTQELRAIKWWEEEESVIFDALMSFLHTPC